MSIEIKISKKLIPYKKAMLYLNKRVEEVKNGKNRELLWILEHPTTYTGGVSFNKKEIIDKKIKIIKSNRGGKITLHNPGQKIIYFVIDLNKRKKDIRKFINSIEKSIIQFLRSYKIQSKKDKKNIDNSNLTCILVDSDVSPFKTQINNVKLGKILDKNINKWFGNGS